jgi:CRP-like cAMP-binding protein
METFQYAPGDTIIAEGTHGEQTYLIKEGQVLICKETGKGRISIAVLSEGEVFGEMYLFDDTGFRSASVVAQTAVSVEVIPREEMERQLQTAPPIVISIMKTLSTRLAQTSQENSLLKFKVNASPLRKLARMLGL